MKSSKSLLAIAVASLFIVGAVFAAEKTASVTAPCCANAAKKGEKCTHACCVEAAKTGDNCVKCKGAGKIETKAETKK
jgi:hypothetical protein